MTALDPQVNEILQRALAHVDAIRARDNEEDQDANRLAHQTFAELFALGMIDRWREEEAEEEEDGDGAEVPTPESWEWNCEPLAPSDNWSEETKARFHRVCGDLNLLHSNDAGLNAAKSNYEAAVVRLRAIDPISAVLCYSRLLRASAYASYGSDVLEENEDGLHWAARVAREAGAAVRDEFELSLIEMSRRLLGGVEDRMANGELAMLLRGTLYELCARSEALPYRRGVPWIVLAAWARTEILDGARLDPFLTLTHTSDTSSLRLHAVDRAEALENGVFYRNGGALSPSDYVDANANACRSVRIEEYEAMGAFQQAHDLAIARLAELTQYETQERLRLEAVRIRTLEGLGDVAAWTAAATELLAWLEQSPRDHWWWDLSGVPALLDSLRQKARARGDDQLAAHVDRAESARKSAR